MMKNILKNIFKVSQSKVNTYRRCRRAYWFKYVERLRRKFVGRPLRFGRIVHDMVEADVNGDDPMKLLKKIDREQGEMFRRQRDDLGEIIDDVRVIMSEYFDHWDGHKDALTPVRMNKKSAEFSFEVGIADGIVATGRLDRIVKAKGLRWLGETKSFGQMPNDDHRWRNLQGALYIRINDMLKLPPVDGIVWDYIRSKPPTRPQLLKSGKMSARGIDTLPLRVIETLKAAKLDPKDKKFSALMSMAAKNRAAYFQRIFTTVKPKLVDVLFEDFLATAKEMRANHGNVKERNIGRHCDWCEYEGLCRAELMGTDVKFIKGKDYEISTFKNDEEPDLEG